MKNRLLYTALLALCTSVAINAGAQSTSPGGTAPGVTPSSPPSTVTTPGTVNGTAPGTVNGTTPGTMNRNGATMGTTPGTTTPNGTMTTGRMSDADIRAYMDARNACSSQPAEQQQACNDAANRRYSTVSPKCQQLTGTALGDCLRGTDH